MEPLSFRSVQVETGRISSIGRLARRLLLSPQWLLALLLVLPILALRFVRFSGEIGWQISRASEYVAPYLVLAALFSVGALRRMRWRQLLLTLAVAGVW